MTNAATAPMISQRNRLCVLAPCALALACRSQAARSGPEITGDARFDGQRVTMTAARGEVLGVSVFHRDHGGVRLELPGVRTTAFAVDDVVVSRASTAMYGPGRGAGRYPDLLVRADPPTSDLAYLEVAAVAPAGIVRGSLAVGDRVFPVELVVIDVRMPVTPPRVWAYYNPRELAGSAEAPSARELACIALFRGYDVALSPDLPLAAWPARRALLGDFPFVPVTLPKQDVAGDVRGWIAATHDSGKVPFAIPIDEPHSLTARAQVLALAATVRAAGGGPGRFLFAVTDEPRAEYGGLVDLYITLRAKRSDQFLRWTYNGAPPRAGSFVVDAAPPGPRTWGWIGWRWQIPVWYVWDALYWHDRHNHRSAPLDIRRDAVSFDDGEDHGNLDGVLALPGNDAEPCRPTLRLAAIRRAMQDRALIELAATCDRGATEQLVESMVPRALGDATDSLAWPQDDAGWETARRRLLELASCGH